MDPDKKLDDDIFRILTIGDPHFKVDNTLETDILKNSIVSYLTKNEIDMVVVMGDILDRFGNIKTDPLCRAVDFLKSIRQCTQAYLYILIGNHDRINNQDFLTPLHPFTAVKGWDKTVVVDTSRVDTFSTKSGNKFLLSFVPYVPPGKFNLALQESGVIIPQASTSSSVTSSSTSSLSSSSITSSSTSSLSSSSVTSSSSSNLPVKSLIQLSNISCIFAHQEAKNAKMGAIVSSSGDEWPLNFPLCISGHVHDYDELQPNFIYIGAPYQQSFGDKTGKTISLFSFSPQNLKNTESKTQIDNSTNVETSQRTEDSKSPKFINMRMINHERITLPIPSKSIVRITSEQLIKYEAPPNTHIKLIIDGEPAVVRSILQTSNGLKLQNNPLIKISIQNKSKTESVSSIIEPKRRGRTFQQLLIAAVSNDQNEKVKNKFTQLFNIDLSLRRRRIVL